MSVLKGFLASPNSVFWGFHGWFVFQMMIFGRYWRKVFVVVSVLWSSEVFCFCFGGLFCWLDFMIDS